MGAVELCLTHSNVIYWSLTTQNITWGGGDGCDLNGKVLLKTGCVKKFFTN